MDVRESTIKYEAWLRKELAGDLVEKDLAKKHDKMKDSCPPQKSGQAVAR